MHQYLFFPRRKSSSNHVILHKFTPVVNPKELKLETLILLKIASLHAQQMAVYILEI